MEPLGGVIITSREIYDAVVRLTGRVDVLIEQQTATTHEVQDHEARIRTLEQSTPRVAQLEELEERVVTLERTKWPLPALGVLIAGGALVVAILPHITK